jgi:Ser/Thr protein kinase RdoA (MazF antagonist)
MSEAPALATAGLGPLATQNLEPLLGGPVELQTLKYKPGRRLTLAARGSRGRAVVKLYASQRAAVVAERLRALAAGPVEPVVPRVLLVDQGLHVVVLSWLPGTTLRRALLLGDDAGCLRAAAALGAWHRSWCGVDSIALAPHSLERELEILHAAAGRSAWTGAPAAVAHAERAARPWAPRTAVHRDLYEEQLLLDRRVGLIDLDDAALGPPELDLGNLLAHVELLALRSGRNLAGSIRMIVAGYRREGPVLDPALLDGCRRLALLRLACIHAEPLLAQVAARPGAARRKPPSGEPDRTASRRFPYRAADLQVSRAC